MVVLCLTSVHVDCMKPRHKEREPAERLKFGKRGHRRGRPDHDDAGRSRDVEIAAAKGSCFCSQCLACQENGVEFADKGAVLECSIKDIQVSGNGGRNISEVDHFYGAIREVDDFRCRGRCCCCCGWSWATCCVL